MGARTSLLITARLRAVSLRAVAVGLVAFITVASMSYMARAVPIRVHTLPVQFVPTMTLTALIAFLLMLAIDAVILAVVLQRHRRENPDSTGHAPPSSRARFVLLPKRTTLVTFSATALASGVVFFGLALVGLPLWFMAATALILWLPLFVSEAARQYRHYGAFALFGTLVLLQLGHLSEHIVQNVQLLTTHGVLAASRGVFGQLDVETVHFYWNIGIWLGTGALLYRYGLRNIWLTIAFIAASLHSVEHIYLYWLYASHSPAYLVGGWNGILGQGGLVGSPLARPYLHLIYNVIEVAPFVLAYYDQSWLVFDRTARRVPVKASAAATG